jgi:hypothetical protein
MLNTFIEEKLLTDKVKNIYYLSSHPLQKVSHRRYLKESYIQMSKKDSHRVQEKNKFPKRNK